MRLATVAEPVVPSTVNLPFDAVRVPVTVAEPVVVNVVTVVEPAFIVPDVFILPPVTPPDDVTPHLILNRLLKTLLL